MFFVSLRAAFAALLACVVVSANAGVVITGTRIVYPEGNREVSVRLRNADSKPVLLQTWIDDGSVNESPSKLEVPFIVTPPMTRVDPQKGQTLRIMYTGADLPQDRESIYYLNVLEVPPKAEKNASENFIQLAVRTRLKLFLRPDGLDMPIDAAPKALTWSLADKGAIRVNNPTPYFITFNRVTANLSGAQTEFSPAMVAPFGSLELTRAANSTSNSTADKTPVPAGQVRFGIINDYGAQVQTHADILPRP